MMFDSIFKNQSLVGSLGELVACYNIPNAVRMKTAKPEDYLGALMSNNIICESQSKFLAENWHHFDIFAVSPQTGRLVLYEVKTRRHYPYKLPHLFSLEKITKESLDAYRLAKKMGLNSKLVLVRFYPGWKYGLEFKDFDEVKFWVDKRNKEYVGRRH